MGKWGGGAWAIGDPSPNVKNFTSRSTAQAKEEAKKQQTQKSQATAGGGVVKITMDGEKQVKGIVIDPAAVDPEDVEMLQDLLAAAFNEATKKVDEKMASEMGKLTSSMGLPPGMF